VCQWQVSGKWPEDAEALKKVKTAFYIQAMQCRVPCIAEADTRVRSITLHAALQLGEAMPKLKTREYTTAVARDYVDVMTAGCACVFPQAPIRPMCCDA
jgi:hypothetical protein